MTTEDRIMAIKIASACNVPCDFGVDEEDNYNDWDFRVIDEEDNYDFFNGVSKLVIVPDEFSFVVKIPFNGHYEWDEESEEEKFYSFENACDEAPDDYCMDEYNKYLSLKKAGFADIAAETTIICNIDGRNFYAQEKVLSYYEGKTRSHPSKESYEKATSLERKYQVGFTDDWVAAVIETYGEEFWKKFLDWNESQCSRDSVLTDMHTGNYGYRMDGRPVIFDISGWRDNFQDSSGSSSTWLYDGLI